MGHDPSTPHDLSPADSRKICDMFSLKIYVANLHNIGLAPPPLATPGIALYKYGTYYEDTRVRVRVVYIVYSTIL